MLLLVSGATATMRRQASDRLGALVVPGQGNAPNSVRGRPFAFDNGAFSGFDADAFLRMLDRYTAAGVTNCLFVTVPDVVADAPATLALFREWAPRLRPYRFPLALVAQDGLEQLPVPWDDFDALFIGGSTAWKLSHAAATLAGYAKARGKWVHVGRVNSRKRMRHAHRIGADSVDGTKFTKFPDQYLPRGVAWMDQVIRQRPLF